jgi:hypothetical protein
LPIAGLETCPQTDAKKWSILPIDLVFLQALKFVCGIS